MKMQRGLCLSIRIIYYSILHVLPACVQHLALLRLAGPRDLGGLAIMMGDGGCGEAQRTYYRVEACARSLA